MWLHRRSSSAHSLSQAASLARSGPLRAFGEPATLDRLPLHSSARILSLGVSPVDTQDPLVTRRLKELGFVPGGTVRVIASGRLGRGSVAVAINGTKFALRHAEARQILTGPVNVSVA